MIINKWYVLACSAVTVKRLIREEGLLVGGSSGTNVAAALRIAARGDMDGPVVTLLPDAWDRYRAKSWMRNLDSWEGANIAISLRCMGGKVPQRDDLKAIAEDISVDFAALFWGQHLLEQPENILIQETFIRNLNDSSQSFVSALNDYTILLVPGLDYKENGPVTGSDLKTQRILFAELGADVRFVEIPPLGSVEENSRTIADAIKKTSDKKILLSGPSSAGPAIHLALATELTDQRP